MCPTVFERHSAVKGGNQLPVFILRPGAPRIARPTRRLQFRAGLLQRSNGELQGANHGQVVERGVFRQDFSGFRIDTAC